jgi:hypothetical protein
MNSHKRKSQLWPVVASFWASPATNNRSTHFKKKKRKRKKRERKWKGAALLQKSAPDCRSSKIAWCHVSARWRWGLPNKK